MEGLFAVAGNRRRLASGTRFMCNTAMPARGGWGMPGDHRFPGRLSWRLFPAPRTRRLDGPGQKINLRRYHRCLLSRFRLAGLSGTDAGCRRVAISLSLTGRPISSGWPSSGGIHRPWPASLWARFRPWMEEGKAALRAGDAPVSFRHRARLRPEKPRRRHPRKPEQPGVVGLGVLA